MNKIKFVVFITIVLVLLSGCDARSKCNSSQCLCGSEEKSYTVYLETGKEFTFLANSVHISLENGIIFFDEECEAVAYFPTKPYFVEN